MVTSALHNTANWRHTKTHQLYVVCCDRSKWKTVGHQWKTPTGHRKHCQSATAACLSFIRSVTCH